MGHKITQVVAGLLIGLCFVGCQGQVNQQGELDSLDNLNAGAVVHKNECRGEFTPDQMLAENRDRMLAATHESFLEPLTAVPTILKDHYFGAGHLLCETSTNICGKHAGSFDNSSCSFILDQSEVGELTCASAESFLNETDALPGLKQGAKIRIVSFVSASDKAHGSVRGIAYALSLYMMRITSQGYGEQPADATAFKEDLYQAYVADTTNNGGSPANTDRDVVFAESVDHYYCYKTQLGGKTHPMAAQFPTVLAMLDAGLHPAIMNQVQDSGTLNLFIFRAIGRGVVGLWSARPLVRATGRAFPLLNLGARGVGRVFGFQPQNSWVRGRW